MHASETASAEEAMLAEEVQVCARTAADAEDAKLEDGKRSRRCVIATTRRSKGKIGFP